MSLEALLDDSEIRSYLRPLIQPHRLGPDWKLTVPPIAKYQPRIGTAFDYALRFGLAARGVGTPRERTVAESAVARHKLTPEVGRRVVDALAVLRALQPGPGLPAEAAGACIVLAGFDVLFRAARADEIEREPLPEEVADVQSLYAAVPWSTFQDAHRVYLNPHLGEGSVLVGGADPDIVIDSVLVDVKTTKEIKAGAEYLRQVACYALLANAHGINGDPNTRGSIDEVGIYFSRAARLFRVPLEEVIERRHHEGVLATLTSRWAQMARVGRTRTPRA
ncbi:MAG: hypothetical protein Q8P18_21580 [Pseudomonadota bacterium]|nr:hypothetical protein [Pseudomonadota bacterium]